MKLQVLFLSHTDKTPTSEDDSSFWCFHTAVYYTKQENSRVFDRRENLEKI